MPSCNLIVTPSSTVGSRTVFMGLLCTLPTQALSFTDNESVAAVCSRTTPSKKMTMKRPPCITNITALNEILEKKPGTVCVMKQTSKEVVSKVRELAIQSDPAIAEEIKMLEAQGVKYVIEVRKKSALMEGGAMDVLDVSGVDESSTSYTQALKNQANLGSIEAVNVDQAAAVKKLLTTVGNLTRVAPDSPAKNQAAQFKYFLEEVSEVVSDLKKTNAPEALLPGAVSAVFAKYKDQCWDGLMKLAGDEAATELQACADVLLDSQHIDNYLKLVEKAQLTPPGPSCEEFDVAFGLLSEVDTEMTRLYRDFIVHLHDIVKPQVDSLDKVHLSQVSGGTKDEEIESQINQLNICIRNYMQCFYNIAQDFAQINRMSVPDKKARLQASMYSRIAGVSRKFWPALEGCLEKLCDSTLVEDIKSKEGNLRKHLVAKSLHAGQLNSDEESVNAKDTSSKTIWNRMISYMTNLLGSKDGVKESDMTDKHDKEIMSPMFSDLLEIVEQLKTYGQIASSSPEESPDVPDTIAPGDHVAICGALGFVSKPKAAALFSYLKRLQKLLEFVDYEDFADEEELASIKKFLNVDYHIMKAIQDEGHPLGVHGDIDAEECDKIMTSTFDRYFKECWPHISAVLQGGDQEESIKGFEGMATDIFNWRDPGQELDPKISRIIRTVKKMSDINVGWYLTGMLTFLQGASSQKWEWEEPTQKMWTDGICLRLKPGANHIWRPVLKGGKFKVCLPSEKILPEEYHAALSECAALVAFDLTYAMDSSRFCDPSDFTKDNYEHEYLYYDAEGVPSRKAASLQSRMIRDAQADGIDVTCKDAFRARWYDATEQVIRSLCNEAFEKTLRDFAKRPRQRWSDLLLDQYWFRVTTHYEGPHYRDTTGESSYEGFVTCSDTDSLTDQEALRKFRDKGPDEQILKTQNLCSHKPWLGWRRPVRVFHSSIKIDTKGQILVTNHNHTGHIGSCLPTLQSKVREYKYPALEKRLGSGEEIKKLVDAFARERELEFKGIPPSLWNDTESQNDLPTPIGYVSPDMELMKLMEPHSSPIMTYLPYVLGVMGAIGTAFGVKKAWGGFKARRDKEYEEVALETV